MINTFLYKIFKNVISVINLYPQFKTGPIKWVLPSILEMGKPILSWFKKEVEDYTYNMDSDLKEACIAAIDIQQKVRLRRFLLRI